MCPNGLPEEQTSEPSGMHFIALLGVQPGAAGGQTTDDQTGRRHAAAKRCPEAVRGASTKQTCGAQRRVFERNGQEIPGL